MFHYHEPKKSGDFILVQDVYVSADTFPDHSSQNLINGNGMTGFIGKSDTISNESTGKGMWLASCEHKEDDIWILFDFGATYPIGEMWVWNYNQYHPHYGNLSNRGLKEIKIEFSLDRHNWTELKQSGYPYRLAKADGSESLKATNLDHEIHSPIVFNNVLARYVKINASAVPGKGNWGGCNGNEKCFGLGEVRFYAGQGLAVVPTDEWTSLFHRKKEWSGADGIYALSFDGCECYSNRNSKSIFLFGDTYIGAVDEATDYRLSTKMINNTIAILDGKEPDPNKLLFLWSTDKNGEPDSFFVPTTDKGKGIDESFYWLQDGVVINGVFYCFPMIIGPYPEGDEGFNFQVYGVTCVSAPIGENGPILQAHKQVDTPLYFTAENGKTTYFGAGIMPNTEEAGTPHPEGYIYIYGLQEGKLVVSRVLVEFLTKFSKWEFWDGMDWVLDRKEVVPIAGEISSEFSVSIMTEGFLQGKYIVAFQENSTGNRLSIYVGDSPVGPFKDPTRLYYCDETEEGNGIYTYNAKGYPHLSKPGELLVSYNVNSTSWDINMKRAGLYRPKFLKIKQLM